MTRRRWDVLVSAMGRRMRRIAEQVVRHKMRVYDFDDTLVSSESSVVVKHGNGEKTELDSASFAYFKPVSGDKIDFADFNNVTKPRVIRKNMDMFKKAAGDKEARTVVLTARPKGSASAVSRFLESVELKGVDVVALQSSDPMDKARWIEANMEGVDDLEFVDDSSRNVAAVETLKGKAKGRFETVNPPHPKDDDYEGEASKAVFESEAPTKAVVETKERPLHEVSDWWREQTDEFRRQYCTKHSYSQYCRG